MQILLNIFFFAKGFLAGNQLELLFKTIYSFFYWFCFQNVLQLFSVSCSSVLILTIWWLGEKDYSLPLIASPSTMTTEELWHISSCYTVFPVNWAQGSTVITISTIEAPLPDVTSIKGHMCGGELAPMKTWMHKNGTWCSIFHHRIWYVLRLIDMYMM